MSPNTMTGGSAPITQNTANTLLGTCWEHRVSASYVFLLACILRSNFFLHSTLLLILGIRLNSSIDITAKRVLMLSKRALRSLRPHPPSAMCCKQNSVTSAAYFVTSSLLHAPPRRHPLPKVSGVSPGCVNTSNAAYLLLCFVCVKGNSGPDSPDFIRVHV